MPLRKQQRGTAVRKEFHHSHRIGWLRAAVLGANDGVVSTSSLVIGVASAHASRGSILLAGVAGLAAGAMAMAAGEYVSVSSQADTEKADLAIEQKGLETDREFEREELSAIYVERGLETGLAHQVADELMAHDALGAHARDELGISEVVMARPLQAAAASAASFTLGAAIPVVTATLSPATYLSWLVVGSSLIALAALGTLAAQAGGASRLTGALRVLVSGALAMGVTAGVGALVGAPI